MTVLVVDNQHVMRMLLKSDLQARGYAVIEAEDALSAIRMLSEKPELIILELSLPDTSGMDLLKCLRDMGCLTPVIILSGLNQEELKIQAFDYGADDYVTKPFSSGELMARVRVALRHGASKQSPLPVFESEGLSVDLIKRIVRVDRVQVHLSPKEYDMLSLLVQNAGQVVMQSYLLERIWTSKADPQYVRTYIRQIRKKIERAPDKPHHILTVNGVGYRLRNPLSQH